MIARESAMVAWGAASAGAIAVLLSPLAFLVDLPAGPPWLAFAATLLIAGVLLGVGWRLGRERRTLVVCREGIFEVCRESTSGAGWEAVVDARVEMKGARPYLVVQKGGRPDDPRSRLEVPLSTLPVAAEDVDALVREACRSEEARAKLKTAAEEGLPPGATRLVERGT